MCQKHQQIIQMHSVHALTIIESISLLPIDDVSSKTIKNHHSVRASFIYYSNRFSLCIIRASRQHLNNIVYYNTIPNQNFLLNSRTKDPTATTKKLAYIFYNQSIITDVLISSPASILINCYLNTSRCIYYYY